MNDKLAVYEIFESIDGEGIRTGYPVTFIRLFGCNLNCSYCDTQYSCIEEEQDTPYRVLSIEDIVQEVQEFGHPRITLTGGEPLIHSLSKKLVETLVKEGFAVNIETNGSIDITPYLMDGVIITMDMKSSSSGMAGRMKTSNVLKLRPCDVLKFVVGTEEDLEQVRYFVSNSTISCAMFLSPIFNKIQPSQLVEFVLKNHFQNVRVQVQLHKIIWDPNKRGV